MNCENAQQNIVLAQYGELPDELQHELEQHAIKPEVCRLASGSATVPTQQVEAEHDPQCEQREPGMDDHHDADDQVQDPGDQEHPPDV